MIYKFFLILFYLILYPVLFSLFGNRIMALVAAEELVKPLLIGIGAGTLLYYLLFRRFYVVQTFEHELTHGIFALLLGGKITGFVVTRHDGGYCQYRNVKFGRVGTDLVGFAPYILPTFTFLSTLLLPLIPPSFQYYYLIWIGITFAYHTASTIEETKQSFNNRTFRTAKSGDITKSDLGKRGLFYSALSIIALTLFFHLLILVIVNDGYAGFPDLFRQLWQGFADTVTLIYEYLRAFALALVQRFSD